LVTFPTALFLASSSFPEAKNHDFEYESGPSLWKHKHFSTSAHLCPPQNPPDARILAEIGLFYAKIAPFSADFPILPAFSRRKTHLRTGSQGPKRGKSRQKPVKTGKSGKKDGKNPRIPGGSRPQEMRGPCYTTMAGGSSSTSTLA